MIATILEIRVSEDLNGVINGSNAIFTSNNPFIPEKVVIYINGIRQKVINDYNTSGNNTVIFVVSPEINDTLIIEY